VPASLDVGGTQYVFVSWSDGGARQHDVTIPAADVALVATYRPATAGPATAGPATAGTPPTGAAPARTAGGSSTTRRSDMEDARLRRVRGGPRATSLRLARTRIRSGQTARIRFRLSRAARVAAVIERRVNARRYRRVRVVRAAGRAGANTLRLPAKLRKGRYRVVLRVLDARGAVVDTRRAPFVVR
jgi:hypothetical protein